MTSQTQTNLPVVLQSTDTPRKLKSITLFNLLLRLGNEGLASPKPQTSKAPQYSMSLFLYTCLDLPHSGVTESYHHTIPNVNLHSITSKKDLYNSATEMEKNPKDTKWYKF